MACLLVTGGAGFIGSCYVLARCAAGDKVINLDKLTYSGNVDNLSALAGNPLHTLVQGDIGNAELVGHLLREHQPDAIVNFAAESHVDRSIVDPDIFIRTNVLGTAVLLRVAREWWAERGQAHKEAFRFVHVSTDEVYGTLQPHDPPFTEHTPYAPNSPYSASKAAADHLVRAFNETYGLPTLQTNCSNNYGPRQFPEKLIPLIILNALAGKPLPVYGTGENIRDWLHVEDHCAAIQRVLEAGRVGQIYNIGGNAEHTNLDIVKTVCRLLDSICPSDNNPRESLIRFVTDRPGHDFRYAIDSTKISQELGWKPQHNFASGIVQTVHWYLDNTDWTERVQSGAYRAWLQTNYGARV